MTTVTAATGSGHALVPRHVTKPSPARAPSPRILKSQEEKNRLGVDKAVMKKNKGKGMSADQYESRTLEVVQALVAQQAELILPYTFMEWQIVKKNNRWVGLFTASAL